MIPGEKSSISSVKVGYCCSWRNVCSTQKEHGCCKYFLITIHSLSLSLKEFCPSLIFNSPVSFYLQDVEITAKALLAKNGESNGFIREDVEKALHAMVEFTTPQRSLLALIAGGAT